MEREDAAAAIGDFQLACFGLLEDTHLLAECLTRLALAQSAAGDSEGFEATFRRVLEIEDRFDAYRFAELPEELREQFEEQVRATIPESFLASTGFPPVAGEARPSLEIASLSTILASAQPLAELDSGSTTLPLATVPEPFETSPEDLLTEADRSTLEQLAQQIREVRTFDELLGILETARDVADRHPVEPRAQHMVAQLAYRASRWEDSVEYFRRGGVPSEDNPNLLFYYAVALYETGEIEEAAAALDRCVTQLKRTDYVDAYVQKILGDRS